MDERSAHWCCLWCCVWGRGTTGPTSFIDFSDILFLRECGRLHFSLVTKIERNAMARVNCIIRGRWSTILFIRFFRCQHVILAEDTCMLSGTESQCFHGTDPVISSLWHPRNCAHWSWGIVTNVRRAERNVQLQRSMGTMWMRLSRSNYQCSARYLTECQIMSPLLPMICAWSRVFHCGGSMDSWRMFHILQAPPRGALPSVELKDSCHPQNYKTAFHR